MTVAIRRDDPLAAYVPDLLTSWRPTHGDRRHMQVPGTLAFVDISGFTALTERLARRGKVGAEELSDLLNATFAALLSDARREGADLVKWGGDAVLLLFRGAEHAGRACRAAHDMRSTLRTIGRLHTEAGTVTLRMSVGVHSGQFDFYLVGDPSQHEELLVVGPDASRTAAMEQLASAGQVVVSEQTAALLPSSTYVAGPADDARLLRSRPGVVVPQLPHPRSAVADVDLSRYLPGVLRTQVLAEPGDAEHRTVTVAFVQFRGTDELSRVSGADGVAHQLDALIRLVQTASAANGVTFFETDIDRDGGKVMLVAGAPRSAGHDEERMLRTARAIVERHTGPLAVRIGVNRGAVFAGDFGPPFRRTYSIKGDAVNLAARVMGKAGPGEVLATRDTLVRSQTRFETEPLAPFLVKGKAKPVDASRVGPVAGDRHERRPPTPFVGRRDQLAGLRQAVHDLRGGRGGEVVVVGDAGTGKTRLVNEVLSDSGARVLRCSGSAYESATAYFPFRALLRAALGDPADTAAALVDAVSTRAPHLAPWLPLLAVPLDVTVAETPETTDLDEQFRKTRLERVVVDLLTVLLDEPTVLVVDDAQHLDAASAALLGEVSSAAADRPWLLVVLGRAVAWPYRPTAPEQLRLNPLDLAESAELVRAMDVPLTVATRTALIERSGGNPMFLEELVRTAGRLGPGAPLPESVQDLMTSQVDQLPPLDRTALRYAAVLGMEADLQLLEQLLREQLGGERLADRLPSMSDLLDHDGSHQVRFRHALLRDVAYEGLPYQRRRLLHGQVAVALEEQRADPALLSLHFFAAGSYDKAWDCSRTAGQEARAKYANTDAVVLFERAVESARRSGSVPAAELSAALDELGDVLDVAGRPAAAIEAYQRSRRLCATEPVAVAELLFKEARCRQRLGQVPQSLRLLTRGLRELEGCSGPTVCAARSHLATRYAWGRLTQGRRREALAWATRAAREAEDAGDPRTLAHAYNGLHFAHQAAQVPEDLPYGRLALRAYEELGDLNGQGHSANNLGIDAAGGGRLGEALALFEQARSLFGRAGNAAEEANAAYNCGDALLQAGRAAEAYDVFAEVLSTARAVADEELVALVTRELGRALLDLGRTDEALRYLTDARQRLTALGLTDELELIPAD